MIVGPYERSKANKCAHEIDDHSLSHKLSEHLATQPEAGSPPALDLDHQLNQLFRVRPSWAAHPSCYPARSHLAKASSRLPSYGVSSMSLRPFFGRARRRSPFLLTACGDRLKYGS